MGILNNHLFQEYPIRFFSLPCQHHVQVKQHPSSGTTFGDCFFTTYQLLLVVLAKIFTSTLSITIFWIRCIHLLTQRCGGSLFSSTSHSPSSLEAIPFQAPLTWSHCVLFWLHYFCARNSSQFYYFIDIFSTHILLDFHMSLQDEDKRGSLPHQVLLFILWICWNVLSSSFCTEAAVAISNSRSYGTESLCLTSEICSKTSGS